MCCSQITSFTLKVIFPLWPLLLEISRTPFLTASSESLSLIPKTSTLPLLHIRLPYEIKLKASPHLRLISGSLYLEIDGLTINWRKVISVIKRHRNLQKISFIGHTLGGLIASFTHEILQMIIA
ncbi:hypothetical protein L1987_08890 [Smallanthus sonchifolius]|uniref:Uncharacterized protein n=1 Tax=Smallanthus sonchifolius TaxID=185202 RepID=A0ACB9JLY0_9ASTR|nr:hypothetical protein L1987_08890 [Smallanthus sonchifolius]